MSNFHIPHPPSNAFPTRSDRIRERAPHAANAISLIAKTRERVPYGSPISEFLNNYHFARTDYARAYFAQYFSQKGHPKPDNELVDIAVANTLNLLPHGIHVDRFQTDAAFQVRADEFIQQIRRSDESLKLLLAFAVGPTGSGKTAFSTSLFCVCIQKFWSQNVIPCRVEYSKFQDPQTDEEAFDRSALFKMVRRCQTRDLLIYLLISGHIDQSSVRTDFQIFSGDSIVDRKLTDLFDKYEGKQFDGSNVNIDKSLRLDVRSFIRSVGLDVCDRILYHYSEKFNLSYFVSFDGFDSIRIEHFLFEDHTAIPITHLISIIRGLTDKKPSLEAELYKANIRSHYLIYLRDTTFEILRGKIFRGVSERRNFLHYWIIPPRYGQMVRNAVRVISGGKVDAHNEVREFIDDVRSALAKHVFQESGDVDSADIASLFGSNARRIKGHVASLLEAGLERGIQHGNFDYVRSRSGIDPAQVWAGLVKNREVQFLPKYIIVEDLYLDETRQLFPKLKVDSEYISERLDCGAFVEVVRGLEDHDETVGTFGCLFNYFYRSVIEYADSRQSSLLLFIRVLQYIDKHPRRNVGDVRDFLSRMGYRISDEALRFVIYLLIRTELVKWDSSVSAPQISDVPLYITKMGEIAHRRLLSSVTYISEAILCALHIDRDISDLLLPRVAEANVWVVDCVSNALVAMNIIESIEEIEHCFSMDSGLNFGDYELYSGIYSNIGRESRNIVRGSRSSLDRWRTHRVKLIDAGIKIPTEIRDI